MPAFAARSKVAAAAVDVIRGGGREVDLLLAFALALVLGIALLLTAGEELVFAPAARRVAAAAVERLTLDVCGNEARGGLVRRKGEMKGSDPDTPLALLCGPSAPGKGIGGRLAGGTILDVVAAVGLSSGEWDSGRDGSDEVR